MANKITVTSLGTTANVNATPDSARYYSDKSKEWAISEKLIDNEDYSSKYYANESKKQADISTAKTTEVIESGNTAVTNIESARDNAITDITNQENVSVDNVNTAGATQIALATEQANIATQQATIATSKTTEVVASGNEALSNIDTAKNNAITSITNQETTSKTSLIDEGATQIGLIQNEGATQVNLATEQATIATTQAGIAISKTTEVVESGNAALSNIETAKSNALNDINTTGAEYVNNAEQYAQNALNSANNAKTSEDNALSYKNSAIESSQIATEQASIAVTNANKAITSANNAKTSETNAKSSEIRCEEILSRLGTAIKIKGRVNSLGDLPLSGNLDGDTYLVGSEGLDSYPEYYWYQDHWEFLGTSGTTLSWGLITGDITAQTDLQTVLDSKQDVIPDLATIRSGASKGATALQSYTETDPVYTADKPNLATKAEVTAKQDKLIVGEGIKLENNTISSTVQGLPIGTIIPVNATSNYVPNGSLPCDGTEYSKSQFTDLWNNYLSTSLLNTCTYTEYASDLSTYGQCGKFAVDTVNNKFRVPLIKDGAVIQQALTNSELGKSYNAGLPNIFGTVWTPRLGYNDNIENKNRVSGAFSLESSESTGAANAGSGINGVKISFHASNSNTIYGNSDTVQPNAVALRYFVVVANGQINQSMMDWAAWASSLQGKANTDLSNLSDSGKKVIDGQWVSKTATLSTATAVGTYTIDLSSYLPNDNYNYEVLISMFFNSSGSTAVNYFLSSDLMPETAVYATGTNSVYSTDTFYVPCKQEIYFRSINVNSKQIRINALGYRRIGTNQ